MFDDHDNDDEAVADRRFVRQYMLTHRRGRATSVELPFETVVRHGGAAAERAPLLHGEEAELVALAVDALSLAEIASKMQLHLGIVRVLVASFVDDGVLEIFGHAADDGGPDVAALERLLNDLQTL